MNDIYSLLGVLTSIEFKDILDILIVSVIIYFLLKFLAGTRGWQILIGLLFLLSVWLLAKILNLNTLEWIFENLWSIGIFAIFVIFQPELRRGLAKLGEKGIFKFFSSGNKKVIDDVIRACLFMAERKIGALIVFERNVDLSNYIEGQVKLDSEVSSELLITIFTPQTPLHDGAVIIKEGKVAYARAFLPLTISSEVPEKIGTRHRAGIGISEETDAVAIVVSEERGEISICVDGKIYKSLDILGLRKKLYKFLGVEKPTTFEILRKKLREKNEAKKQT
ncbi:diadenylate cyclase CdaA [Sulfurihydrogenibium subterraneum]|uniref:diadenylate cyclase CdaA n=1 Tax=Sulfurihydrogenibium subterraneum TaxID=171121 RepID=UPI00048CD24A|nr:diadenylate cyclase CdaA [Sulfurihydrogenibium subterraneum]